MRGGNEGDDTNLSQINNHPNENFVKETNKMSIVMPSIDNAQGLTLSHYCTLKFPI